MRLNGTITSALWWLNSWPRCSSPRSAPASRRRRITLWTSTSWSNAKPRSSGQRFRQHRGVARHCTEEPEQVDHAGSALAVQADCSVFRRPGQQVLLNHSLPSGEGEHQLLIIAMPMKFITKWEGMRDTAEEDAPPAAPPAAWAYRF